MKSSISSVQEYQQLAESKVAKDVCGFWISGSDDEVTLHNNINTFNKIYLNPKTLIDMTNFSMKTTILGK